MNLLTIEKMTKSYTDRILFDSVTMGIGEGDKIGVIGINGTGKSTLLKIISGIEEPDLGNVTKGGNVKIEYLAQDPEFDYKKNIIENVTSEAAQKYEGWNIEGEAKNLLNKVGIWDYEGNVETLSGGQKKRVALVRALLSSSDILVLDEPTNHLDNEMAEWLQNYLNKYSGALIMVTHDRYFLDKVTNKILEIDKGNLYMYQANYSKFLELKAEREDMEQAAERKNRSLYRMDLEWMMRGARARSTKQKAHIQRFEELKNRKVIETNAAVEMNSVATRLGNQTVELTDIKKSYGDKLLFQDFSYIFLKNDRIGIIGPNGCGKSTLLKVINGIIEPDEGNVRMGQTVKIAYFSQENEYMDDSLKVIDYIKEVGEYIKTTDGSITASQMLERFLFTGALQYSLIGKLSGGEKRRLYLLRLLMEAPNILILDEPTNDLDIKTLSILENYLDRFQGIVITVSHDRYFLDRTVQRIFAFEGEGAVVQYEGGYSDYYEAAQLRHQQDVTDGPGRDKSKETDVPKNSKYIKTREAKLKFSFQEQRDYETIDSVIADLEENIEELDAKIEQAATDFAKLNELMEKKGTLEAELEEKMERWMYLNDLAEQIEQEKNQ